MKRFIKHHVACGLFGTVLTLSAFFMKAADSRKYIQNLFEKVAQQQAMTLREQLEGHLNNGNYVRLFFEGSNHITWDEFETFLDPLTKKSLEIKAVAWIPRLAAEQRQLAESEMRSYGLLNFSFMTLTQDNQRQVETHQPVYLPVYYVNPYPPNRHFHGLNLSRFSEKAALLKRCITEGEPVVCDSLRLNGRPIEPGTHCIYVPVYKAEQTVDTPEERAEYLAGFVGLYLDMEEFLRTHQELSSYDIILESCGELVQATEPSHRDKLVCGNRLSSMFDCSDFFYHVNIPIADKVIDLNIRPSRAFIDEYQSLYHWLILPLGMMLSGLSILYLNAVHNRRQMAEDLVNERTRELQHQKEKADRMARQALAASKAKTEFLSNMSHEIRTPLNSIIGFGDLLAQNELNDEQRDYVDTILGNGKHLLRLINDILDLARIESGKLETTNTVFDPSALIEDVRKMLCSLANEKHLELTALLDDSLPEIVVGDVNLLRQCLINLAGNAIKFTHQGYVQMRAAADRNHDGIHLRIEVRDTGIGISQEQKKAVFEAFCQADNSSTREYYGTGLGLTITKKIIELLGGYITLESELHKGTTFTIILPVQLPASVTA